MCILAYAIIGVALLLFVQARNVMPQLLLVRLLFSVGAAGTSTMITAILPTMTAPRQEKTVASSAPHREPADNESSVSPELTFVSPSLQTTKKAWLPPSPTRSAGFVGLFSGCGALLALLVFLRLPDLIEGSGISKCPLASKAKTPCCLLSVSNPYHSVYACWSILE